MTDTPELPQKGQIVPLRYSRDARQRVIASIRWDAREETLHKKSPHHSGAPAEKLGLDEAPAPDYDNPYTFTVDTTVNLVTQTFDVDLVALICDASGKLIDAVSPDPAESVDRSGKIYHSGDETHGVRGTDDEVISVELKDLPEEIFHIVFIAICQSGHSFDKIIAPEGRIADGKTETDLMLLPLAGPESRGKTACILARLFRGEKEWMLHAIGDFRIDRQVADWGAEIQPYLKGA